MQGRGITNFPGFICWLFFLFTWLWVVTADHPIGMICHITNLDRSFYNTLLTCRRVDGRWEGAEKYYKVEMAQEGVKMAPPPTEMLLWRSSNLWQGIQYQTHTHPTKEDSISFLHKQPFLFAFVFLSNMSLYIFLYFILMYLDGRHPDHPPNISFHPLLSSPTFFVVSLFVSLLQQHQHQNAPFCQQWLSSKHILRSGLMPRFWGWEIMVLLCALSATLLCSARPLSHGGNGAKWFNGPKLHTLKNT